MCAVCHKPVDELRSWREPWSTSDTIEARCHGASEIVDLSDALEDGPLTLIGGTAFQRERDRLAGPQVNDGGGLASGLKRRSETD